MHSLKQKDNHTFMALQAIVQVEDSDEDIDQHVGSSPVPNSASAIWWCRLFGGRQGSRAAARRHVRSKHGGRKKHVCTLCGMAYKWDNSLQKHKKRCQARAMSMPTHAQGAQHLQPQQVIYGGTHEQSILSHQLTQSIRDQTEPVLNPTQPIDYTDKTREQDEMAAKIVGRVPANHTDIWRNDITTSFCERCWLHCCVYIEYWWFIIK